MSSTRRSEGDELNQERWCSSSEFTEGTINALAAAKRIALINDPDLRELLWFIQHRSLRSGGIKELANDLVNRFPDHIGAPLLRRLRSEPDRLLTPAEVTTLSKELPDRLNHLTLDIEDILDSRTQKISHPKRFSSRAFTSVLDDQIASLPKYLVRLCLDPEWKISLETGPWWYRDLFGAIRTIREALIKEAKSRLADTAISRKMHETLEFCYRRRRMVFIEGAAGIGRSATLQAWCDEHAGMVRYVAVPSSNDDRGFYAKIAEALGVARGTSYNGQQIKLRVEETLRISGLVIALDESQYLWPQYIRPRGIPSRLLWIKTAFDAGTPFAIVAHSDFSKWQELYVLRTMWTDEQWERRINRKVYLPSQHSPADMILIAKVKLPHGDEKSWKLLAGYALAAEKKQASGITELLESARDRAALDRREKVTFEDIAAAIEADHLPMEAPSEPPASDLQLDCNDIATAIQPQGEKSGSVHRRSLRPSSATDSRKRATSIELPSTVLMPN